MLGLRKPNFNTKIIPFEKSHNAGNCERGDPLRFFNIHSVAKCQKLKGDSLESLIKNFRKMRNFNGRLIVPKNLKGPFGIFKIRSVARYQTKRRMDPL